MSSEPAIVAERLGKSYQIYTRPQDRLKQFVLPRLRRLVGRQPRHYFRDFWALSDFSLTVERGETVGIIGRNGSGKSTLLQLVCGTLNPTQGSVAVSGRVAALLELGSGFNPEFTGRENVYLNAAVLGLSRREIDARYADVLAFADIGEFIDQPVKTYSSGMMVRLAFAVIAHVDADILIIDEALAVGDAIFTQKCMRWLRNFQKRGTILFVSHDTGSVLNLCERAVWLDHGRIERSGRAKDVVEAYLEYTYQKISGDGVKLEPLSGKGGDEEVETPAVVDYGGRVDAKDNVENARGWKTGVAEVTAVELESLSTPGQNWFAGGEKVRLRIRARANQAVDQPILGFLFRDRLGQDLFGENTLSVTNNSGLPVGPGQAIEAVFEFRLPMLPNGHYEIMASIASGTMVDHVQHHWLHNALIVNVSSGNVRYGLVGIPFSRVTMEVCS